ncbi:MAG: (d)CMP kinase [Planctomycetota bacterium]
MTDSQRHIVVTIDGPAGSGKSTVARLVASRLGCSVLDTGALYRALTLLALEQDIAPSDRDGLLQLLSEFDWRQEGARFFLGEREITQEIRSAEVTANVSEVSAHPEVRKKLIPVQRAQAEGRSIVTEGRDMGTVVFPDAEHQFYLDAELAVRARRRGQELEQKGDEVDLGQLQADLKIRDQKDSTRQASPLQVPERATKIDTTDLTIDQVVERIVSEITGAG